jgi:hypothetical protein
MHRAIQARATGQSSSLGRDEHGGDERVEVKHLQHGVLVHRRMDVRVSSRASEVRAVEQRLGSWKPADDDCREQAPGSPGKPRGGSGWFRAGLGQVQGEPPGRLRGGGPGRLRGGPRRLRRLRGPGRLRVPPEEVPGGPGEPRRGALREGWGGPGESPGRRWVWGERIFMDLQAFGRIFMDSRGSRGPGASGKRSLKGATGLPARAKGLPGIFRDFGRIRTKFHARDRVSGVR